MRKNSVVRIDTLYLLLFVAGAAVVVVAGAALLRVERVRLLGGALLMGGTGALAVLVLAHFTGRFGPDQLWFRSPSFAAAVVVLLVTAAWWLRRPARALSRFAFPVALAGAMVFAFVVGRLDGRGTPLAVLLPTLDARAPELSWTDDAGHRRTLAELRGNVVLVNFWATWCVPCRREMPMLSKLQREYAADGLVVLYLSMEEPEVVDEFLARTELDGVKGRLHHAAEFYGAGRIFPLSFLISRDGRVSDRWSGRPREDWLQARILARL